MKQKAAFFDRDGTLIVHHHYLAHKDQVELLLPVVALAKMCQDRGYKLFMVTNQSGIARGFFDEHFVQEINAYINDLLLAHGILFTKTYYCPHHPDIGDEKYRKSCGCRKPLPGMLHQAAQEYALDLSKSFMFGDKQCDLLAGVAAGCRSFDITKLIDLSPDDVAKVVFSGTLE